MLGVMIVPTGIGAVIGGHSGDATSAAHLLAACCDKLILHPNVVNASDLTEHPANSLYVEGAMLDSFLSGETLLQPVRSNHVLVVCNEAGRETVNCVNAMRSILGVSAEIVVLQTPLSMVSYVDHEMGVASGRICGVEELVKQISDYDYDALAVHTPVQVDTNVAAEYVKSGGINPWGGVEAMLSKELYWRTGKPNAHAPIEAHAGYDWGITDPRLAPEMICGSHLGCVLKGLQRAPRPVSRPSFYTVSISSEDVDVLVSPLCWGTPHEICRERKIPMIFVHENSTTQESLYYDHKGPDCIDVETYLEAAGALMLMKMGRSLESVRRPLRSVHHES